MGLGTYLLGAVIEKAAPAIAEVAVKTTVGVTAVVAAGTTNVIGGVTEAVSEANKNRKQREKPVKMIDSNRVTHSEYDASLICAKVAICSYIIHADSRISDEEKNYIDKIFMGIKAEYGKDVLNKAKRAYDRCSNFMNVQDYLRGVQTKDLKRYLQAADEVALVDGYDKSEVDALQRIKNYISPPEAVEFPATTCQSCGGRMCVDEYGYKAVCNYCGIEIILNSNNKPVLAYQDGVKATNKSSGTDMVQDKRKKGKMALKVALGVMTGGVSLIPDAVSAVKKKN